MLRAALRYFSDSERSELDKCDIPGGEKFKHGCMTLQTMSSNTYCQVSRLATTTLPYFLSLF
jgi:hypothetical protein